MNHRLARIFDLLRKQDLDAFLVSSVPNITYLTNYSNFSKEEREAFLLITKDDQYIFTDGRYSTAIKKYVADFNLIEITLAKNLYTALNELKQSKKIYSLGIEESDISVSEYKNIKRVIANLKPAKLQNIRISKSPEEIKDIKKACQIGDKAFNLILNKIKPGLSELQVAYMLENLIRLAGADLSFDTIVAFGQNAAVPHHQTGKNKLKTNDLILIDFGVKFNNYCSDMTRTVVIGKATDEQKKVYQKVLNAQTEAINFLKSKFLNSNSDAITVSASEVDQVARSYLMSHGYPNIPHSLGHGIGLEVHEPPAISPISDQVIPEGSVFSIEPGIYIPGKFGIRIEDLFVMQNGKLRQLTNSPKDLLML